MSPTEQYDAWQILHARIAASRHGEYGSLHWGPYGATVEYWMQFEHPIGICQRCNDSSRIVNDNMSKTRMHMGGARKRPLDDGSRPICVISPNRPHRCDLCRAVICRDCAIWKDDKFSEGTTLCVECLHHLWSTSWPLVRWDLTRESPQISVHFRASALTWGQELPRSAIDFPKVVRNCVACQQRARDPDLAQFVHAAALHCCGWRPEKDSEDRPLYQQLIVFDENMELKYKHVKIHYEETAKAAIDCATCSWSLNAMLALGRATGPKGRVLLTYLHVMASEFDEDINGLCHLYQHKEQDRELARTGTSIEDHLNTREIKRLRWFGPLLRESVARRSYMQNNRLVATIQVADIPKRLRMFARTWNGLETIQFREAEAELRRWILARIPWASDASTYGRCSSAEEFNQSTWR